MPYRDTNPIANKYCSISMPTLVRLHPNVLCIVHISLTTSSSVEMPDPICVQLLKTFRAEQKDQITRYFSSYIKRDIREMKMEIEKYRKG
jgi:hypothetical protein